MKHFESVLAFGDSHVAGCELDNQYNLDDYLSGNITIEEADASGKLLAFPQRVADHLNVPCYNYAMSGGSNARSLRLLIQAVQTHPNSLVLFGYTSTDRSEMYHPTGGLGCDSDKFLQLGVQWNGVFTSAINNFYIKNLHPRNNLAELMFCVDNICSGYAADYLHLPLFAEQVPDVDNVFKFEGYNDYLTWCKARSFKQLAHYHYEHAAHVALAKLIIKEIRWPGDIT
jgi:hypothetical protein